MGCKMCAREETGASSQDANEMEKRPPFKDYTVDNIPTLDAPPGEDQRIMLSLYARKARTCHVKLAADPGKPRGNNVSTEELKLVSLREACSCDSGKGREDRGPRPSVDEAPSFGLAVDRHMQKQEPLKICLDPQVSSETPSASRPVVFDHSALVLENRGSLGDSYQVGCCDVTRANRYSRCWAVEDSARSAR